MRRILGTVKTFGLIASIVSAPAAATMVTVEFEGPVTIGFLEPPPIESFIRGQITYDTSTPAQNVAGRFDRGEAVLYEDAIVSWTFTADGVSRSYDFGDIRIWNDYEPCSAYNSTTCFSWRSETDEIRFYLDVYDPLQEMFILGTDQGYLSSGDLPDTVSTDDVDRAYMYWAEIFNDDFSTYIEFSSDSLRIVPAAIPEPGTAGLLLAGLLSLASASRRLRKASLRRTR